jgi:hypothetical protein
MRTLSLVVRLLPLAAIAACSGNGGSSPPAAEAARLVVAADTTVLEPSAERAPTYERPLAGVSGVDRYYRLTTPAATPFSFELVAWQPGSRGDASIAVAHLRDGASVPTSPTSLGEVGIAPAGQGLLRGDTWLAATGDGFARLELHGAIDRDQLLAVRGDKGEVTLVEIVIGEPSVINRPQGGGGSGGGSGGGQPLATTLYSSDSLSFGRADPFAGARYELRLQHDDASGDVTVGASVETSADTGWWRNHEVFALFNVLGVVRADETGVHVQISYDRGATFAQDVAILPGFSQSRLVQVAIAADYSLAVGAWRTGTDGDQQFVLVEGQPSAVDANGSPTWFQFAPAQVLWTRSAEATPLTTGITWSQGGDLVVGYGATSFAMVPTGGWLTTTEFRCWTRRYGQAAIDREVDREAIFGMDPSVAVTGQGAALRVFYTYEVRDGVRLSVSNDAGQTWAIADTFGHGGDHLPSVFVRPAGADTRVDVLYLASRAQGSELHRSSWTNFGVSPRVDEALTTASTSPVSVTVPAVGGVPHSFGWNVRTTQIGWLAYDATLDGDDLVVVYDEVTQDSWPCFMPTSGTGLSTTTSLPPVFSPFQPATPPPLAPGLTEPAPPIDPLHRHQLKLVRLQ